MSDDAEYGRRLRIVIPGGSGNVGRMLADTLQERGHQVTVLTRGPYTANWQTVHWDGEHMGPWGETLDGADVCTSGRWIRNLVRRDDPRRWSLHREVSKRARATFGNPDTAA